MTLTQLSYVVAVDTHGHFGRAAESCFVTQPALSMQVRKLEQELGVVLFDRARSPVLPTEIGRLVVEQARVVLREAARVSELKDESAGVTAGELRVGVLPTLGPYLLPRFVHGLARRYPELDLVLEEGLTDDLVERLREERLDIALIATPEEAELVLEPLFEEPLVAYAAEGHPIAARSSVTPADLPREDFWLLSEAHCLRAQTLQFCDGGDVVGRRCTNGIRMESGNLETLKRLVENGEGFTLLPVLATEGARREGATARLVPFEAPVPTRTIYLARRRVQLKRRLVSAFLEALMASLPAGVSAVAAPAAKGRARSR